MRRTLGTRLTTLLIAPLLAASLAACGSDGSDTADDPADPAGQTDTGSPAESATDLPTTATPDDAASDDPAAPDYEVVGLYSATAAGGVATTRLTGIGTPGQLAAFVAQFRNGSLVTQIEMAARGVDDPRAAIVGLGCDVPPGVEVTSSGGTLVVQPQKVTDPLQECLAPVTTVVVISVGR